ncbi:unnamed protein product [Effrenium voratum]|nr:unnamed protein product [Effrenium voratum]
MAGVLGSWLHGAPRGEWHPHAWKLDQVNGTRCRFPRTRKGRQIYDPCGAAPNNNLHRVLGFFTGFFNLTLDIQTLSFRLSSAAEVLVFRPAWLGLGCAGPEDVHDSEFLGGYPVRLVQQGRYLHHWLIVNATCGTKTASIELRVWPRCVEVHSIGDEPGFWATFLEDSWGRTTQPSAGYAGLSFCCSGSRCHFAKLSIPSDCCPLGESQCGWGPSAVCSAPLNLTMQMQPPPAVRNIDIPGLRPVWGDGHAWRVLLESGTDAFQNDAFEVVMENPLDEAVDYRIVFHYAAPKKITGVAAVLRLNQRPSGQHLQLSKNWHTNDCFWGRIRYDGTWFSAIAELRLPAGAHIQAELVVAYQFFGELHTVSHAQLSLIGWAGSNGLWEEVGLGAEGESITYEPNLQQRRAMVLDTRPFLVCAMDIPDCACHKETNASGAFAEMRCQMTQAEGCRGDVNVTGWTENSGGSDFLVAINEEGSYQYLTNVTARHTSNGPLLTNASYLGVTADGAVLVERTVSTWATNDLARHLHSFTYQVLRNVSYARLALYVLGADWYNFVADPGFAHGDAHGLKGTAMNLSSQLERFEYSKLHQKVPCGDLPCWFALLDPSQARHVHRGLVLRRFEARQGGGWSGNLSSDQISEAVFSLLGADNYGERTLGLELGLADMQLQAGDVISGDVELLLYPKSAQVHYGHNLHLGGPPWQLVAEARDPKVVMAEGHLQRLYFPRVAVNAAGYADFSLDFDYPGVLPVTIAGVKGLQGCLCGESGEELGGLQEGAFQVDFVPEEGYAYTYSLLRGVAKRFHFKPDCRPSIEGTCQAEGCRKCEPSTFQQRF